MTRTSPDARGLLDGNRLLLSSFQDAAFHELYRENVNRDLREEYAGVFQEPRGAHEQVALSWVHVDEDVDVALLVSFTTGNRPEQTRVLRGILLE